MFSISKVCHVHCVRWRPFVLFFVPRHRQVPQKLHRMMQEALEEIAVDARGVQVVSMSALTGQNVGALMPEVLEVYEKWNLRLPTSLLNKWLWRLCQVYPPPAALKTVVTRGAGRDKGRATKSLRLKLKYLTQVGSGCGDEGASVSNEPFIACVCVCWCTVAQINIRPPTFALFSNRPDVPEHYRRCVCGGGGGGGGGGEWHV